MAKNIYVGPREFTGPVSSITVKRNQLGQRVVVVKMVKSPLVSKALVEVEFTDGMVQQARALNPGDEVTITAEWVFDKYFALRGLSIIGNESIV